MLLIRYKHRERAWRNGRRSRLKILCPIGRVGSSPTVRTTMFVLKHFPLKIIKLR